MSTTTWPKRDFRGKQPWEHDEPPVEPRAGLPLLTSGSADPVVHQACALLAELGYDNPAARGENPYGVLGAEEMQAFRQFRADFNVREDASMFGGDHDAGRQAADNHVGPWTLEALIRAAEKHREEDEAA